MDARRIVVVLGKRLPLVAFLASWWEIEWQAQNAFKHHTHKQAKTFKLIKLMMLHLIH